MVCWWRWGGGGRIPSPSASCTDLWRHAGHRGPSCNPTLELGPEQGHGWRREQHLPSGRVLSVLISRRGSTVASTRSDQPSDPTFNSCCFATCSRRSWPKGMCGSQLAALLGSGHTPWGAHSLGGMVGTCPAPSLCARLSLWSSGLPQGIDFGLLSFYGQECFLAHGHPSAIGQSWGCVPSPAHCAVHMTSTLFRLLFLPAYRGCPADCSLAGLLPGPTLNLSTC